MPPRALMLAPCAAVHTAFMRFALDVVFVDKSGRVRKIVQGLEPWRMSASFGAYAAIELAAGGPRDLVPGDRLYLSHCADADTRPKCRPGLQACGRGRPGRLNGPP